MVIPPELAVIQCRVLLTPPWSIGQFHLAKRCVEIPTQISSDSSWSIGDSTYRVWVISSEVLLLLPGVMVCGDSTNRIGDYMWISGNSTWDSG